MANSAHSSKANENHTTTDGTKPQTAVSTITDPDFLPTLDEAPATQHVKSHLLLLSLIVGGVFSAWFVGFKMFQVFEHQSWGELALGLGAVVAAAAGMLYWTGSHFIDWWELVTGFWWLSMPVAGAAGLLLLIAQEQSSGWHEVD